MLPIETPRLRLRLCETRDAPEIAHYLQDWAVTGPLVTPPWPFTDAEARGFVRKMQATQRPEFFVIADRETDDLIGGIGFHDEHSFATRTEVVELGYWLGQRFWGQGLMTEALAALLPIAMAACAAERLIASVNPDNLASQNVLRKLGFACIGLDTPRTPPSRGAPRPARWEITRHEALMLKPLQTPSLFVAALALLDPQGRVLLAQRPEGKHMAGLWEFPGGKIASHETPQQALVREAQEELSLSLHTEDLEAIGMASHAYAHFHLLMPLYKCCVWQGTPRALEGQELAWVHPQDMTAYPMPPADVPLVQAVRSPA